MHLPDGFLDTRTAVATAVLAAAGVAVALRHARDHLPRRRVPLLGLAAAFVFAAQMINFPVAGGTSGHLVGAVLAAVLLGPSAGVIVIAAVLLVQCLVFADGGISALGANVLNMAVLAAVCGWAIYRGVSRLIAGLFGLVTAAAFAGWCSTVIAAVACAGELATSGTVAWPVVLPAMAGVHMLIGVGEAAITALVLVAVARARPDLLAADTATAPPRSYGTVVAYGSVIAFALALFASPLASRWPDGLERTAEALGFAASARAPLLAAPAPGYSTPGVHPTALAMAIAGGLGSFVAFALSWVLARLLVRGREPGAEAPAGGKR